MVKTPMPTPIAIDSWYGRRRFGPFSVVGDAFVLITNTTLVGTRSEAPTHGTIQQKSFAAMAGGNDEQRAMARANYRAKSAVVSAVEFTNAGGERLQQFARDRRNVVDGIL